MQCAVLPTTCVNKGKPIETELEGIEFQHRRLFLFSMLKPLAKEKLSRDDYLRCSNEPTHIAVNASSVLNYILKAFGKLCSR